MDKDYVDADEGVKPGWQTTEFWSSLGAVAVNFVALLVVLGRLDPDQAQGVGAAVTSGLAAMGTVVANAAILWGYGKNRADVKVSALNARAAMRSR